MSGSTIRPFRELPVDVQRRVTFLILDLVLGEEMVETWVGAIDTLDRPYRPTSADRRTLLPAVAAFAAEHTLEDGSPPGRCSRVSATDSD